MTQRYRLLVKSPKKAKMLTNKFGDFIQYLIKNWGFHTEIVKKIWGFQQKYAFLYPKQVRLCQNMGPNIASRHQLKEQS